MKKEIVTLIVLMILMLGAAGCEEFLMGAGAGAAGTETLQDWRENLEEKKAELAKQYEEILIEIQNAPDPNALKLAKEKAQSIQLAQVANAAAITVVDKILPEPGQKPQQNLNWIYSAIPGVLFWLKELRQRKGLEKGLHRLEGEAQPDEAKRMHDTVKHYTEKWIP